VIVPSMFVQTGATALLAVLGFVVTRTSLTPVVPVLVVIGLMSGSAHGLLYPGLAAMVTDHAPETRRGVIVAMFSAVFLVGQTAGAFAFGYITHALGYRFMWMMLASFLLLGAALSMRLVERRVT
jgi:MFS family permease